MDDLLESLGRLASGELAESKPAGLSELTFAATKCWEPAPRSEAALARVPKISVDSYSPTGNLVGW